MNQGDLKIGMHLTDDGRGSIPLYGNLDATGEPFASIAPGQYIGQIVDLDHGIDGLTVIFKSEFIETKANVFTKTVHYLLSWSGQWIGAAVKFSDLNANVSSAQVDTQLNAITTAEASGFSISNEIKKIASAAGETISDVAFGLIPWKIIGVGVGLYIALHWKDFKPATTKK